MMLSAYGVAQLCAPDTTLRSPEKYRTKSSDMQSSSLRPSSAAISDEWSTSRVWGSAVGSTST